MAQWTRITKKVQDPVTKAITTEYGAFKARTDKGMVILSKDLFPAFDPKKDVAKLNAYVMDKKNVGETTVDLKTGKKTTFYGFGGNREELGEATFTHIEDKLQESDAVVCDYASA